MMLILTVLVIFILLVSSEVWWRTRRPHDEFSRKFIHIVVGSMVAFAPFYLQRVEILVLSVGFIVAVGISKYFNIFQSIHSVERQLGGRYFLR